MYCGLYFQMFVIQGVPPILDPGVSEQHPALLLAVWFYLPQALLIGIGETALFVGWEGRKNN